MNTMTITSKSLRAVSAVCLFLGFGHGLLCNVEAQCPAGQGNATLALAGQAAVGNSLSFRTSGAASAPALFLLGTNPGPVSIPPWGTLCVGVDASLVTLLHFLSAQGTSDIQISGAATVGLLGQAFHVQDLPLDASAPNGTFAISNSVSLTLGGSTPVFADDFESYALGTFPSSGGWSQYWGNALGTIVSGGSSGSQSFQLVGAYCWSAVAYHPVPLGVRARYEVSVMATNMATPGCGYDMIHVSFWTPPPCQTWGCSYDGFQFAHDGFIYGAGYPAYQLQAFQTNRWYRCAIQADFQAGTYCVEIDGRLFGPFPGATTTTLPGGIVFYAGHGQSPDPAVRFDDVRVFVQ